MPYCFGVLPLSLLNKLAILLKYYLHLLLLGTVWWQFLFINIYERKFVFRKKKLREKIESGSIVISNNSQKITLGSETAEINPLQVSIFI